MYGKLIIVRHSETSWNRKGIWTGINDIHLDEEGVEKARKLGALIQDLHIDEAIVSTLARTNETLAAITSLREQDIPKIISEATNERDYGEYGGKNKWEFKEKFGEETFHAIRRGWDEPVPGGETLKMTYERVIPYYKEVILPKLIEGKNILLVSHGNTIRALVKYMEKISDENIFSLEISFNEVLIYTVDSNGYKSQKEIRTI